MKCKRPAVTYLRYNGTHLCQQHFVDFFEKRVKREIANQCNLQRGSLIAVGLSGGKDSSVATHILNQIFKDRKDVDVEAIIVDEGIEGYRPGSIKVAKRLCEREGIPLHQTSFKDVSGWSMDEIVKMDPGAIPCSYCGVFRRHLLNLKAKEIGAAHLATGLNLDDTTQSILMNIARNDVERLARLGPHSYIQEGLVPRIQPLRIIPEKESYLYALLKDLEIWHKECPYSARAQRGMFRQVIYQLEEDFPGTRHSILKTYDSIAPLLLERFQPEELKKCKTCGEPTTGEQCRFCRLVEKLDERATS